jgi:hypothetical protein
MSRAYTYTITLQDLGKNSTQSVEESFDHSICHQDILNINKKYSGSDRPDCGYKFVSALLTKITGDSDYRFICRQKMRDGKEVIMSYEMAFDHKITSKTMRDDYLNFKRLFFEDKEKSRHVLLLEILIHVENNLE